MLAGLGWASPASATFPGPTGQVAYSGVARVNHDGTLGKFLIQGNEPAWSPDARTIAYSKAPGDNKDVYTVRFDGTDDRRITTDLADDGDPAWSPDGSKIVFVRDDSTLHVVNANGTLEAPLHGLAGRSPNWSPDGQKIAYETSANRIAIVVVQTGAVTQLTGLSGEGCCDREPNWSPDGQKIAFSANRPEAPGIYSMNADGTAPTRLNDFGLGPTWSPDGTMIAYSEGGCFMTRCFWSIRWMHADGTHGGQMAGTIVPLENPDWGSFDPADIGYPRPRSASPLRVALVPAYDECTAPNRTHGPPLAEPSCAPPVLSSTPQNPEASGLTFGTPDANGEPARSQGFVRLKVVPGDVKVEASLSDVRCRVAFFACPDGPLSDYTGELQGWLRNLRVTDREGATSTIADLAPLPFTVPCSATPSSDAGSACAVTTTFNTLLPGVAVAGSRATWQLGRVEVFDGGGDGDAEESADNEPLATRGVFIP
ncbi:MAG: TolB family protein [Solirubrobacterales bacterium]